MIYGVALAFAALNASSATLWPHQRWGVWATWGSAAGLVASLALALTLRSPLVTTHTFTIRVVVLAAVVGCSVIAPLSVLSAERADGAIGTAQSEVHSVESMGFELAHGRSPYPSAAAISREAARTGAGFKAYRPYEPAMGVFGLPRAWFGEHGATDARVILLLAGALITAAAAWLERMSPQRCLRLVQLMAVVPPTAMTIATGGDDMPVVALCLLSLALASRRRWAWSGAAIGVALAMKVIVVPVAVVLAVLAVRANRKGRRWSFVASGVAVSGAVIVPFVIATPNEFWENVVRYPLGLAQFHSSAASSLPGYWIATNIVGGHTVSLVLVAAVAVATLGWLVRRPPDTSSQAALIAAVALAGATLALPAARFGYLLYPLCLFGWAMLTRGGAAIGTSHHGLVGTTGRDIIESPAPLPG